MKSELSGDILKSKLSSKLRNTAKDGDIKSDLYHGKITGNSFSIQKKLLSQPEINGEFVSTMDGTLIVMIFQISELMRYIGILIIALAVGFFMVVNQFAQNMMQVGFMFIVIAFLLFLGFLLFRYIFKLRIVEAKEKITTLFTT